MQPRRFYYLASLLFVFAIPLAFEGFFIFGRINKIYLLIFVAGITFTGSVWDIWASRHGKKDPIWIWQWNEKETLGIKLFDLPIEEYLFYVVSSAYIIFTWETIRFFSETGSVSGLIFPALAILWSALSIGIPYALGFRGKDKL